MNWAKTGKTVSAEGTIITYELSGTPYTVESRKRHIPHTNGRPGTWDHTSYFVLNEGEEVIEKYSLADAKKFAESEVFRCVLDR